MATKNTATTGTVNLLVDNDDLEGQTATVVIVGPDGQLLAQRQVTIGSDT